MSMNTKNQELRSTLSSSDDEFSILSTTALLARKSVPALHRELANNYVLIKKIYKFPAVKSAITEQDKALLKKYSFNLLAETNIETTNKELELIRKMSASEKEELRLDSAELIKIRTKELKCIIASKYPKYSNEINNGYMAIEKYFEEISKYYS